MTAPARIRMVVGVGNAGVSVLDRLALDHPEMKGLLVVNNDQESLGASIIPRRITVPEGDVGDGFLAIEEEFGNSVAGSSGVLLCGGLGGECGSRLLPALAARAKAAGIITHASVGMPFTFEGNQKRAAAASALKKLQDVCEAVSVIENDRLSGGVPSTAAVGEAFEAADRTLLASLLSIHGMLSSSGPVKITRNDIASVLGNTGAPTHFGFGRATGSNRLHEALERAMKCPLLALPGKASSLHEAKTVLLFLRGPQDLSFAEVQMAVAEIERLPLTECHIKVGVDATGIPGSPMELFLTTSSGAQKRTQDSVASPVARATESKPSAPRTKTGGVAPVAALKNQNKPPAKQTQGVLDLESYQRGRFDKSEPTIVEGEDLDVPTFLRKGIRLSSLKGSKQ